MKKIVLATLLVLLILGLNSSVSASNPLTRQSGLIQYLPNQERLEQMEQREEIDNQASQLFVTHWIAQEKELIVLDPLPFGWEISLKDIDGDGKPECRFGVSTEVWNEFQKIFQQRHQEDSIEIDDFIPIDWELIIEDNNNDGRADDFTLRIPPEFMGKIIDQYERNIDEINNFEGGK